MLVGKYYVIICILEKLLAWEAINNLGRSKKNEHANLHKITQNYKISEDGIKAADLRHAEFGIN